MSKIFCCLTVLIICFSGCGALGEDPQPFPGPNADGSVTLFVNGGLYNFDYTAQFDGIQLNEYVAPKPDGTGGAFTNMGSGSASFAGNDPRSRYSVSGTKSMEFGLDIENNMTQTWTITLFDTNPIMAADVGTVSFWAMYSNGPMPGLVQGLAPANITFSVWTTSGYQICSVLNAIPAAQRDGQWYRYTAPLSKSISVTGEGGAVMGNVPLSSGEAVKRWAISVPANAGRIYVDEIVIQ